MLFRSLDEVRRLDFGWSAGVQCDLALADALLTLADEGAAAATPGFEQAVAHLSSAGLVWDAARAHLAWGTALRTAGHAEDARCNLAKAASGWQALGIPAYARLAEPTQG